MNLQSQAHVPERLPAVRVAGKGLRTHGGADSDCRELSWGTREPPKGNPIYGYQMHEQPTSCSLQHGLLSREVQTG